MIAGIVLLAALAVVVLASLASLFFAAGGGAWQGNGSYLLSIAEFTLYQALLSTVLSLFFGGLVALALARRHFRGRRLLLALFGVATALPAIVAVFAFAGILGRSGAVNRLLDALGLPGIPIYGLTGILLVHVFFNGAFAARVFLAALEAVPGEHWRLASALGMPPGALFRLIDWPVLRRDMPALALLIFIVCATSFTIPLTLGGGPGSATFEVAIYQAIHSDADFGRAALLALLQIGAMAVLVGLAAPLLAAAPEGSAVGRRIDRPDRQAAGLRLQDAVVLAVAALLVLPPLGAVIVAGRALLVHLDPAVPHALATSLIVAFLAASLALAAALLLSRSRGALAAIGRQRMARLMGVAPLLTLATPPLALAAGLYVIARWLGLADLVATPALILVNAMMALPFVHRLVDPPMALSQARYGRLAESLGMAGLARLRLIEWPLLGPSATAAFAFAMALSLGDLGVVALFGSQGLVTLPALLYAKLGSYRIGEADGIAALLAGLVLVFFWWRILRGVAMLVVDDLTIRLEDWTGRYDLTVPRGALAAMVGPSGGGKSTLLHAIAGFERPSGGRLLFDGTDLLPLKPAARPVAIVFQDHNLLPNLTALQNAGLAVSPSLRLSARDRTDIGGMLDRVGLAGMAGRLPSELSGGQRQRVALARAMLTTRPLLLLDEPLTGLDPAMRIDMVELVDALRREKGLTVLMTTHTPDDVEGRADHILTVADGRIVRS